MSDILLDEQSAPTSPASGQCVVWPDATASKLAYKDDSGRGYLLGGGSSNASAASQTINAADTYLTDSDLLIPSFGLQARTKLLWEISVSKTAAGVAAPVFTIRQGSARTVADTARLAITGSAQTAAADVALIRILAILRNIGAAGILQGTVSILHNLAATGFASNAAGLVEATSAGFDTTTAAGQFFGLSINSGASGVWTVTQVRALIDW
jgi:hypothetical protein